MKIAYILPSLAAKAPIFLAKCLSDYFIQQGFYVEVFYFDEINQVSFNCRTSRISISEPIMFDDFQIIHSHMMRPDKYVAKFSKLIKKAKCVSTIHCDIYDDLLWSYGKIVSMIYSQKWLKWLLPFDATVQINDYLMNLYNKKLSNNVLIYNGVSISYEQDDYSEIITKIESYKSKQLSVLCSYSGIVKRKGLMQILKLLKIRSDLAYVCIGEGDERKKLIKYVKKNKLEERVSFYNFKKNPYLVLPYSDVFVMPSYSEGFSLALLEAGLIGCSAVCSNIPAINIPFSSSEVSFFELDNIDSLSKAVDSALKNKLTNKEALRHSVVEKYSVELMCEKYKNLYISLQQ